MLGIMAVECRTEIDCAFDEMVELEKLIPNPKNPHTHPEKQVKKLARLIELHGWRHPITVSNRSGFIVAGHCRLAAAKLLKLETVPVDYQDFASEAEEWAVLTSDNNVQEFSEIDDQIMGDGLKILDELNLNLEDFTALDEEDISSYLDGLIEPNEQDDVIPEKVEPVTKTGDLWLLGDHRLLCGDSTKEEDIARLMDRQKADMVFTDPPYNVGLKYESYNDRNAPKEYLQWCRKWFVFLDKFSDKQIIFIGNINTKFWIENFFPNFIGIWDKGEGATTHGYITNYTAWEPVFFHGQFNKKRHTDIFRYGGGGQKVNHPCPKPVGLFVDLLENFTKNKDFILDLFLGSGSTLIACEKLNRRCFGMEIEPIYCDVIVKRWEDYTGKKAKLDGSTQNYLPDSSATLQKELIRRPSRFAEAIAR